jgi:uncharacterized protein (DUF2235 family)
MLTNTNIWKLANGIVSDGSTQLVFYDSGVGTDGNLYQRIVNGATGEGLEEDICQGYATLINYYRHGDRIWMFGFSRGSYTVRSLAGMLRKCGLPPRPADGRTLSGTDAIVRERFELYRAPGVGPPGPDVVPVHFIGVFDTVGALGIPETVPFVVRTRHQFHNVGAV